jgi:hypothetical protein
MLKTSLFSNKAQSLIELSIFATVIMLAMSVLVGYGMNANYNHRMMMMAFKRAMELASQVEKTSIYATIQLVYDKSSIDPANEYGVPRKVPFSFSSSAVRSNMLYSELDGTDEEIPRTVYDINGKIYSFRTAAYVDKGFVDPRRKVWIDDWDGKGIAWKWEYPGGKNKIESGTSWDIDNDGEDEQLVTYSSSGHESVVAVDDTYTGAPEKSRKVTKKDVDHDTVKEQVETITYEDGVKEEIITDYKYPDDSGVPIEVVTKKRFTPGQSGGLIMDSQDGELNFSETAPSKANGLTENMDILEINRNSIANRQMARQFQTRTMINNKQVIKRFVRLNPQSAFALSDIEAQIEEQNKNNNCNYNGNHTFSGAAPADLGPGCDYILQTDDGQTFLVVNTYFGTNKDAYFWTRAN